MAKGILRSKGPKAEGLREKPESGATPICFAIYICELFEYRHCVLSARPARPVNKRQCSAIPTDAELAVTSSPSTARDFGSAHCHHTTKLRSMSLWCATRRAFTALPARWSLPSRRCCSAPIGFTGATASGPITLGIRFFPTLCPVSTRPSPDSPGTWRSATSHAHTAALPL